MKQHDFEARAEGADDGDSSDEPEDVYRARKRLYALLQQRVAAHTLNDLDAHILILRLGLERRRCHTLDETASLVQKSPETVRQHQYLALRHASRDPRFLQALQEYSHLVQLPRGVTYYLHKMIVKNMAK